MTEAELQPMMEPTRHKCSHIDDCLRQIDDIKTQVIEYQTKLNMNLRGMESEIKSHLWVTADFMVPAAENLKQTQKNVEMLLARVSKIREGFELLPREIDFVEPEEDEAEEEPKIQFLR